MLVKIGNANDVADGQMRVFDLAGTRVNVANASGELYAFDETCTHSGCSLANGQLEGTTVTCGATTHCMLASWSSEMSPRVRLVAVRRQT